MKLSDFDYDLPEDRIATRPARPKTSAKLLVAEGQGLRDLKVADLSSVLQPGDRLILNDTKVIPARLSGTRRRETPSGDGVAKIEITLLTPNADHSWMALAKPLRKLRPGEVILFSKDLSAEVSEINAGQVRLTFNVQGADFDQALAQSGAMPLPPYIEKLRPADDADRTDYQPLWARRPGAVAAPTASLHFDDALIAALGDQGVTFSHVTLHVGAGTFLPVKVEDVATHKMHSEWGEVSEQAAAEMNATRAKGGRIIPVGTTALRLIETAADKTGTMSAWRGDTDIFIYPGYGFKITDGLMTNFHLPKSTLLMLVSALIGQGRIKEIYAHAVANEYRFFSYGDASLLLP